MIPILVRVLDRLADRDEQLQAFPERQPRLVAVPGDGQPLDHLHDEIGAATPGLPFIRGGRGPGVEDFGDVGVVHQRQRLPLGLEPGDHLAAVHPGPDQLQGHPSPHAPLLHGHVNHAHPAFADGLEELVGADDGPGSLQGLRRLQDHRGREGRAREEAPRLVVGP
jgi:hypothetical protein